MEGEKKGLNNTTIGLMVGVALFFDALQALLTVVMMGWLVTPVAYLTFWLWFKMKGVKFFTMKRAPTLGIGALLEIIPGVDVIPAITFTVIRVALDTRFSPDAAKGIAERVAKRTTKSKDV